MMIREEDREGIKDYIQKNLEKDYVVDAFKIFDIEDGYFINFMLKDLGLASFYIDIAKKELSKKPFRALYVSTRDIDNEACEDEYDYDVELDEPNMDDVLGYLKLQIEREKTFKNNGEFEKIYKESLR